jgi:hypothetical protein
LLGWWRRRWLAVGLPVVLYAVPLFVFAVVLAVAPSYFEPYPRWPGVAVGVAAVVLYVLATRYVIRVTRSWPARRRPWQVQLAHRCGDEPGPAGLAVEVTRDGGRSRNLR